MNIWLPNGLYQVFPLLYVIVGFLLVALIHNPLAIVVAACMYGYSFFIMWMRLPEEDPDHP